MRFDWNDMQYFLAVARGGTVSEAARRMGVNHATVIRRIDALERSLATKLFERTPRGYGLTKPGERLLQSSERIEAETEQVRNDVGGRHEVGGTVRISSLEGFGNFFLARRLPAFARAHPRLRIELITIQQIVALSRREADVAITVSAAGAAPFESTRLVDYSLHVYGTRQYLAQRPVIALREDFLSHAFSGYIDDLVFTRGLDYLGEIVRGLRPSLQSSSLHAQMQFACAGNGLCVLPTFIARTQPELVAVLPKEVELVRTYWLVKPAPTEATLAVHLASRFIEYCVAQELAVFS